jgi:predicted exporter
MTQQKKETQFALLIINIITLITSITIMSSQDPKIITLGIGLATPSLINILFNILKI